MDNAPFTPPTCTQHQTPHCAPLLLPPPDGQHIIRSSSRAKTRHDLWECKSFYNITPPTPPHRTSYSSSPFSFSASHASIHSQNTSTASLKSVKRVGRWAGRGRDAGRGGRGGVQECGGVHHGVDRHGQHGAEGETCGAVCVCVCVCVCNIWCECVVCSVNERILECTRVRRRHNPLSARGRMRPSCAAQRVTTLHQSRHLVTRPASERPGCVNGRVYGGACSETWMHRYECAHCRYYVHLSRVHRVSREGVVRA